MPASFLKRYRFEDFIEELDAFLKANLGGYIDQMNTDKTDLVLIKPGSSAYYFQAITGEVPYSIFVYYGEVGTQTRANGPEEENMYALQLAIILENGNELQGILGKRMLRYRDCLKALMNEGWNKINKRVKIEVSNISPFPFSTSAGSEEATHVGIGLNLEITIT